MIYFSRVYKAAKADPSAVIRERDFSGSRRESSIPESGIGEKLLNLEAGGKM